MADKKQEAVATEKVYTIPLRKEWLPEGRVQRTNKSVRSVRMFVERHTHASDIKISEKLNSALWAGGAKNALHTIRVKVNLIEDTASVRLPEEISLEEEKKQFLEREKSKKEEETKKAQEAMAQAQMAANAQKQAEEAEAQKEEKPAEEEKPEEKKAEEKKEKPKADKKPEKKKEKK